MESIKEYLKKHFYVGAALLIGIVTAFLAVINPFYALDAYLTDKLYTKLTGTDSDIIIIGVDEETLAEYGNFNLWSREKSAELLEYLHEDETNCPAVVGLDFMFIDSYDEEVDARLAKAAALYDGQVVLGTNVVYRGALETDEKGRMYYNTEKITDIETAYPELTKESAHGYTNVGIAKDGCVRYTSNVIRVPDELKDSEKGLAEDYHDSFALAVCRKAYEAEHGDVMPDSAIPVTDKSGQYQFFFSGREGEFQHVSMRAVLAGEVPHEAFRDKIVLVGAYAPGFQDSYRAAIDRDSSMYGVEIHANIVQAIMSHKTMVPIARMILALITAVIVIAFLIFAKKKKLSVILITSALLAVIYIFAGRLAAQGKFSSGTKAGLFMPCVYILLFLILADIYFVIEKYVLERIRRKATLDVFKKYVAPEVVDNLSKTGNFELHLGGEKRNVAVLFVDIRGFTPLSEGLPPEKVVAILNEYLKLTTTSILNHKGTLDKFIGDATMAVFNAPFDQEDYIYQAVAAAWDIKAGSRELGERLYKEFGKQVGFGVGVNCGEAVVGNIGCDFRMDYTAIGDTVNTAARLESNAKAEQILISEDVYRALQGRIQATPVGEIPLKGKSNKIMVYSVDSIEGEVASDEV